MTWILPKQLHTSPFVPATEALISDLSEQSQICAQSLLARSKVLPSRTWSQKWKRDSWTQHLSGRILKHSLGQDFVTAWTSSLAVIPASHSAPPENAEAKTTQGTSGRGSQMEFDSCALESASLKTSKDTSALDSEKSLKNWQALVTKRRGEYLARLKSARLTSASGSSSWPTANARDWKDSGASQGNRVAPNLGTAVHRAGPAAPANPSTNGSRPESWATPRTGMARGNNFTYDRGRGNIEEQAGASVTGGGKLNPRWVETLMGLPVGWTMPSCASPVTIELMNSGSSETESSLPPLNEHSER